MNYLSILPLLFVKQTKKRQVYSDSVRFYHFGVQQFIEFHICYVALSSFISLSTVILGIPVCLGDANK